MVAHTFNPSILEAEADGSVCLGLAWSTYQVLGQQELPRETLISENKTSNFELRAFCFKNSNRTNFKNKIALGNKADTLAGLVSGVPDIHQVENLLNYKPSPPLAGDVARLTESWPWAPWSPPCNTQHSNGKACKPSTLQTHSDGMGSQGHPLPWPAAG